MVEEQIITADEKNKRYFQEELTAKIIKNVTERNGQFTIIYGYIFEYGPTPPEGGSRFDVTTRGNFKSEEELLDNIVKDFNSYAISHDFPVKFKFSMEEFYNKIKNAKRIVAQEEIARIQNSLEKRLSQD